MRILIAGILGGIVMYLWATAAHTVLPLGAIGMASVPDDTPVAALQASLGTKSGLFSFPSGSMESEAAAKAYEAKLKTAPQGFIVYRPAGTPGMTPRQLITEAVLEIAEAVLLAAVVAIGAAATFGARMSVAAGVGLIAAVTTNVSYWNWYGFGLDYTLANAFIEFVKYVLAGLVIAWWYGRKAKAAPAAA